MTTKEKAKAAITEFQCRGVYGPDSFIEFFSKLADLIPQPTVADITEDVRPLEAMPAPIFRAPEPASLPPGAIQELQRETPHPDPRVAAYYAIENLVRMGFPPAFTVKQVVERVEDLKEIRHVTNQVYAQRDAFEKIAKLFEPEAFLTADAVVDAVAKAKIYRDNFGPFLSVAALIQRDAQAKAFCEVFDTLANEMKTRPDWDQTFANWVTKYKAIR